MASGEGFSSSQRAEVDRAIRAAEMSCRLEFSVYVGPTPGEDTPAEAARRLHATLASSAKSVLILVDPGARAIEVVTGPVARAELDDEAVRLAVAGMSSAFAGGDYVGGIKHGVAQLAESARHPETLHG